MIKSRAFTFIEIIIALTVLLTAVLGSSTFFFVNRQSLRKAELRRQATWDAVDRMEGLKSLTSAADLRDAGDADDAVNVPLEPEKTVGNLAIYRVEVTIGENGNGDAYGELVTYIAVEN